MKYIQIDKERNHKVKASMESIRNDNLAAKENGVSYGMYKAGLSAERCVAGEGYVTSTSAFLRPGQGSEKKSSVAFILKRNAA